MSSKLTVGRFSLLADQAADEITFPENPGGCDHIGYIFIQNYVKFLPYAGTLMTLFDIKK